VSEYKKSKVVSVLTSPVTMTTGYQDIGSEIDVVGYNRMFIGITIDINSSNNLTVKPLGKFTGGATEEYALPLQVAGTAKTAVDIDIYEVAYDADGYQGIRVDVSDLNFIQIQAKVLTAGATAADIEKVEVFLTT